MAGEVWVLDCPEIGELAKKLRESVKAGRMSQSQAREHLSRALLYAYRARARKVKVGEA
jgi:hypothetical protein